MIDAHHHLWSDPRRVPWIADPSFVPLQRSFEGSDWTTALPDEVDGSVLVEAGTGDPEELATLLDLASSIPTVRGVVGWVDTSRTPDEVSRAVAADFARSGADRWLKGLRIQAQAHGADHLDGAPAQAAADLLATQGSVLEVVGRPQHLPSAARLARRIEGTYVVLDHAGKPDVKHGTAPDLRAWRDAMQQLARVPSSVVKISGLVTEANWSRWTPDDLRPYVESLLELFGPQRLMFGSDWPVCLLAAPYTRVLEATLDCLRDVDDDDRADVMGGTATRVYDLAPSDD